VGIYPTLPMAKLIFEDTQEEFELPDGSSITEVCEEAGVPFACTEGVCGTCVIEVVDGMENLSEFNQAEADFLGDLCKERLACQCKIKGGCVKIKF
jgi:ferredoxin